MLHNADAVNNSVRQSETAAPTLQVPVLTETPQRSGAAKPPVNGNQQTVTSEPRPKQQNRPKPGRRCRPNPGCRSRSHGVRLNRHPPPPRECRSMCPSPLTWTYQLPTSTTRLTSRRRLTTTRRPFP